jgi:hypothetical protein
LGGDVPPLIKGGIEGGFSKERARPGNSTGLDRI